MKLAQSPENETHGQGTETQTRERKARTKRTSNTGTGARKRVGRPPNAMRRQATSAQTTTQAGGMEGTGATDTLPTLNWNTSEFSLMSNQRGGATLQIGQYKISTSGQFQISRVGIKA